MMLFDFTNMNKKQYIAWNLWATLMMAMITCGSIFFLPVWWAIITAPIYIAFLLTLYKIRRCEKILRSIYG